jgi:RHS repeat-associated protein
VLTMRRYTAMTPFDACSLSVASRGTYKFTGKERDSESGLDYFGARFYGSNTGRFMSPDLPFYDGDLGNPQKLNLYTYGGNNPLNSIDPDGHFYVVCTSNQQGVRKCERWSNQKYADAIAGNNPGINAPAFGQSGNITCGGEVCGSADYYDEGYASPEGEQYLAAYVQGRILGAVVGAAWSRVGGWLGRGAGETGAAAAGKATVQDVLKGATRTGGTRAETWTKGGGVAQAVKDFDALEGQGVKAGNVMIKELPDGQGRAVLRTDPSTWGGGANARPTLEVQPAGGGYPGTKIRYNP